MSALRKAGVWLGLVEEEDDDRSYDDGYESKGRYRESGYRDSRDSRDGWESRTSRYAEEFAEEDEEIDEQPPPRTRPRLGERVPLERSPSRNELPREPSGRGTWSAWTMTGPASGRSPGLARRSQSRIRLGRTWRSHPRSSSASGPSWRTRTSGTRSRRSTRRRTGRRGPSASTSATVYL
ncbi:hypothetical protein Pflav_003120 [Phytohabitans flavus]|uniref:Cell division protein SepF n=1 Tax=Phytohabitans flavus TaxID=1076124 RepID=A0A6F8XJB5_9ACTN|nr:hypothetical protein Pflav_003120 [Phytohabitans flavus]